MIISIDILYFCHFSCTDKLVVRPAKIYPRTSNAYYTDNPGTTVPERKATAVLYIVTYMHVLYVLGGSCPTYYKYWYLFFRPSDAIFRTIFLLPIHNTQYVVIIIILIGG